MNWIVQTCRASAGLTIHQSVEIWNLSHAQWNHPMAEKVATRIGAYALITWLDLMEQTAETIAWCAKSAETGGRPGRHAQTWIGAPSSVGALRRWTCSGSVPFVAPIQILQGFDNLSLTNHFFSSCITMYFCPNHSTYVCSQVHIQWNCTTSQMSQILAWSNCLRAFTRVAISCCKFFIQLLDGCWPIVIVAGKSKSAENTP